MDIKIEARRGISRKHIPYIAATAFGLLIILWRVLGDHSPSVRADERTVTISEVAKGQFNDYARVSGQVQSIQVVQLSPLEGGIVERLIVEEGASVRKGNVIMVLSNPMLNLSILDSEAQLAEKQNFLRNTLVTMEQEKLSLRQERLQLDMDVARKERKYRQSEELYNESHIPREEYLQSKEDWELADRRRVLVIERQRQDSIYRTIQVEQMEESLGNMRRNMELIRQRVDNLEVKSPIDGEIGSLDVVPGQSVTMGQRVGQINDLSDFKVRSSIDEHYIDRVHAGLEASFERQGGNFPLKVRKVYPDVSNSSFKVDFIFTGDRPDNIRTGQTYYINLELGQPTESVIVPRGQFYQVTGGGWIFVVSEDGGRAVRREIRIGRQNPQYYEVLEGLEPGENVITSSYKSFGDNEVVILK